jgi:hypothetical protein
LTHKRILYENVLIKALEGAVWEERVIESLSQDEQEWENVLNFLDKIEDEATILGASAHIMAIANKGQ